jgi:hypothetical protein
VRKTYDERIKKSQAERTILKKESEKMETLHTESNE